MALLSFYKCESFKFLTKLNKEYHEKNVGEDEVRLCNRKCRPIILGQLK